MAMNPSSPNADYLGKPMVLDPISDLDFDSYNPRLPESLQGTTDQVAIFQHLVEEEGVTDVITSLATNGYLAFDPMLATLGADGKYIVIEGNRRLAALKYILDSKLRRTVRPIALPHIEQVKLESLKRITIQVIESESSNEVVAYLGYKHISGARQWGPEEKARYVQRCLQTGSYSAPLIAKMLGVKEKDLWRPLAALYIIDQARQWGVYDFFNDRVTKRAFGTLYTAFGYPGVRNFVGIVEDRLQSETPVPDHKKEELGQLLRWMFGDKRSGAQALLRDSRQLGDLDSVLQIRDATKYLESSESINQALRLTPAAKNKMVDELKSIDVQLRGMMFSLPDYSGDASLLEAIEGIIRSANSMLKTLRD